MNVRKRDGSIETVSFDKVLRRITLLSKDLPSINAHEIAQKICSRIYDGVSTHELDELTAQLCSSRIADNPEYDQLASRIIISNHHKKTSPSFSETVGILAKNHFKLVNDELLEIIEKHKDKLNTHIDYNRDYLFDYFGFKTLERSYLMRNDEDRIVERPQHMLMRVALGIHGHDIKDALETYDYMSLKRFIHATPTLFNYGTPRQQGSSCFLLNMNDDSIAGIYESLSECAAISKYAGGIGMHIHNVRAKDSVIRGTNGKSDGIVPMLRVFNATARYVNQSGKRNGSIAVYLEPWHADVEQFLDMRKNHGNEEDRARDLFYALWIPDLFMRRVRNNEDWCLMCPDACRGLSDVYGEEFDALYEKYEAEGKYTQKMRAQTLWYKIIESQIETGTPYMLYKDAVNSKNNQSNLGVIKSSNLCCEIVEFTSPEEVAVCNLASLCLPSFIKNGEYDFEELGRAVSIVTKNLNKIIDRNFYPLEKARRSNLRHRPIAIGVQGLSDTFMQLRLPYEGEEAAALNRSIFECIYYHAMHTSVQIAKTRAEVLRSKAPLEYDLRLNEYEYLEGAYPGAYSTFEGSPTSQGKFQFDLWGVQPSSRYDWEALRVELTTWGARNSLLVAPMPTASTAQIMGFTESFELPTSNIFTRNTMAGHFIVVNKYLIRDLLKLNLWDKDMKERIIADEGSIQQLPEIPEELRALYKTAWEIKQRAYINMAKERGAFVCQSQSMNIFVDEPNLRKLNSIHFHAWECGLKTGMYYLRTKPKATAQKFSIDPSKLQPPFPKERTPSTSSCDEEVCTACSA
jgi:ribonucleotide reductase alpha subunit